MQDPTPAAFIRQRNLEMIQWVAFSAMLFDHLGAYVWPAQADWMRYIGRLAFPLFSAVFAWRLAYLLWANPRHRVELMFWKMLVSGLAAHLAWAAIGNSESLNIMFGFMGLTVVAVLTEYKRPLWGIPMGVRLALAAITMVLWSEHVEFGYPGMLLMVALYGFCRWGGMDKMCIAGVALLLVAYTFPIHAAVLAAPAMAFLSSRSWGVDRKLSGLFYWLYPLHIVAILALALALR